MDYGDRLHGSTFDIKFTTSDPATRAPATLSGTPVVSIYPANSTTEITAGITLTVDIDALTGLNNVRVDLSGSASYARRQDYHVVITTGTVGGVSAVGYVIGTFGIENRYIPGLLARGICPTDAAHSTSVVVLASSTDYAAASMGSKILAIKGGTNKGYVVTVVGYNNTWKQANISPALPAACDNTSEYELLEAPAGITATAYLPAVNTAAINGVAVAGAGTSGNKWRA